MGYREQASDLVKTTKQNAIGVSGLEGGILEFNNQALLLLPYFRCSLVISIYMIWIVVGNR